MRRVIQQNPLIGEFVAERAKCRYDPSNDVTLGVIDDSKEEGSPGWIRGGVIFTDYTGSAIWIHTAGIDEMWVTREMLWKTFHYAFVQLGCARLYGIVEEANLPALTFDLKLGFNVHTALPSLFASGAGLIVSMTPETCRWLRLVPKAMEGSDGRQGG